MQMYLGSGSGSRTLLTTCHFLIQDYRSDPEEIFMDHPQHIIIDILSWRELTPWAVASDLALGALLEVEVEVEFGAAPAPTLDPQLTRQLGRETTPVHHVDSFQEKSFNSYLYKSVLRIHDIFIRIRGSMPLTMIWLRIRTCYFHYWPSRRQQKTNFEKFFCLLLFEGTFPSFSQIKVKTVGIKVFLTVFAWW
jgi:hypothetical protein